MTEKWKIFAWGMGVFLKSILLNLWLVGIMIFVEKLKKIVKRE